MDKQKVQQFIIDARKQNVPDSAILSYLKEKGAIQQPEGVKGIPGVAVGAAKGAVGTIKNIGEMVASGQIGNKANFIDKIVGLVKSAAPENQTIQNIPSAQDTANKTIETIGSAGGLLSNEVLSPQSKAEKLGKGIEQIGEFFVPAGESTKIAGAIEKAASGAVPKLTNAISRVPGLANKAENIASTAVNLGSKAIGEAAVNTGLVAAQTGGNQKDMIDTAIISAAFPVAGKAASSVVDAIKTQGKEFAPRLINSLIKPAKSEFAYGKNPGKAVAEAGIVASSLDELATKIGEAKNVVGSEIGQAVQQATDNGKLINTTNILNPIDEKIAELSKTPKTNSAAINRLEALKDDLKQIAQNEKITPLQAFDFKQMVGNIATFTGNASDDKAINSAAQDVYRNIKKLINESAQGIEINGKTIENLNESYGGLLAAEKATINRAAVAERNNLISLGGTAYGLGGALIGALSSGGATVPSAVAGATGVMLEKALSSEKVRTNVASWLLKSTPEERLKIYKAIPALKGIIIKSIVD